MQGIRGFDPGQGEYEIVPSEFQRNADRAALQSGSEAGDVPMWHRFDVKRKRGGPVLEVVEDRRGMEGMIDVSGRQFLLRPPDEAPVMALSRQGGWGWNPTTLRNTATDEVLGAWKQKHVLSRSYEFRDANDQRQFVAARPLEFGTSLQTYRLRSANGDEIGELNLRKKGEVVAYEADVTVERSSIPPEITLAVVCGIFRSQRTSRVTHD